MTETQTQRTGGVEMRPSRSLQSMTSLRFKECVCDGIMWVHDNKTLQKLKRCIEDLAKKLNIKPIWIPISLLILILMYWGILDRLITNSIGFFYPAWMSFKAMENADISDNKQWLTYWIVYGGFSLLEAFSDLLLSKLPLYYILKIVFLLWLFLPQWRGAGLIYSRIIRPLLIQHQKQIDELIERCFGGAKRVATSLTMGSSRADPKID